MCAENSFSVQNGIGRGDTSRCTLGVRRIGTIRGELSVLRREEHVAASGPDMQTREERERDRKDISGIKIVCRRWRVDGKDTREG